MLLTDTNILQRIVFGKAMVHAGALTARGVRLATTDRNVLELRRNLLHLGLGEREADEELARAMAPFDIIAGEEYDYLRGDADARLREGGKSDWPALAAALAFDGEIWTGDIDFFGVGVPVWTTPNLRFVEQEQ